MNEVKSKPKFFLGVSIIFLGVLLLLIKPIDKTVSDSFEDEPVKPLGLTFQSTLSENEPKRIIIPELSIDLLIKKALVIDGYWEVFEDSAGWGEGSGIPGMKGNQVIFAHSRKGLFSPLKNIKKASVIYVLTDKNWFSYKVRDIREVYPEDTAILAPTDDETLTLYTCSGFSDTTRMIVTAKRLQ